MGDPSMDSTGLLNKISSSYNNPEFSDVEFVFISESGEEHKIFCHKFILALRSKYFASLFFGPGESPSAIRFPVSKKASFELLFKFLYTDNVQFHTYEEAQEVFNLAEKFRIEELYEKCYHYILKDQLSILNIFPNYDHGLKRDINVLLKDCRKFVCCNTQSVLKSSNFMNASPAVVEDIIKQDNLSVSSELDVIKAVLDWGREDLERKNIPCDEKSLRKHINPFMKHLRFLTLSSSEFDSFVENYDILTAKESNVITKKILQPECNVNFPEGLCFISFKRNNAFTMDQFGLDHRNANSPKSITSNPYKSLDEFRIRCLQSSAYRQSTVPNPPKPVVSASSKYMINDSLKPVVSNSKIRSFFPSLEASDFSYVTSGSKSTASVSMSTASDSKFTASDSLNSKISYELKKCSVSEQRNSSYLKQKKSLPSNFSVASFSLGSGSAHYSEYSFPLEKIQPCIGLSFHKDITCSITFKMISGSISLRGFELKVKNENNLNDNLIVEVYAKGFSESSLQKTYKCKLDNDSCPVSFTNPLILREGNKGELEVSIENLLLTRCHACVNGDCIPYEINTGLNFTAQLHLKSNQKNDGFLFLFNKLLYTVIN